MGCDEVFTLFSEYRCFLNRIRCVNTFINIIKSTYNLYENLHLQISLYKLSKIEKETCDYIIDSLDEDGYLRIDENEIKSELINNEINVQ